MGHPGAQTRRDRPLPAGGSRWAFVKRQPRGKVPAFADGGYLHRSSELAPFVDLDSKLLNFIRDGALRKNMNSPVLHHAWERGQQLSAAREGLLRREVSDHKGRRERLNRAIVAELAAHTADERHADPGHLGARLCDCGR